MRSLWMKEVLNFPGAQFPLRFSSATESSNDWMLLLHTCAHNIPLCSKIHWVVQDCPVYYKLDTRLYSDSLLIDQTANKSLEVMPSINGKRETKWNYVAGILLNSPGLYGHNSMKAKNVISFPPKSVKASPLVENMWWT